MTDGDLRKPAGVAPVALKRPNAGPIGLALNAGMLLGGVHFFGGGGMLSIAHSDADIDTTLDAFDTTISRMRDEGIV
jgi:glutamate-1-semialdehyde 2,1-aminomutase